LAEQFQGVMPGLTIPLWEHKNKLKYAKANVPAIEKTATDKKVQLYNQLKLL
jgi:transcriptional regulator